MNGELSVNPAPGSIVVRPFDRATDSKVILLDPHAGVKITSGTVVKINRSAGSPVSMVDTSDSLANELSSPEYYIQLGDQVIFASMSGMEVQLPEPKPDNIRNMQTYIVLKETNIVCKIEENAGYIPDVTIMPRG